MASIVVDNVGIVFPIYDSRGRSLKSRLYDFLRSPSGQSRSITLVEALRGVSLQLRKGDRMGIIGRNGSGKTTLLRVLSGIYEPTSGHVNIEGTVASMTDMTMGMDPDATGEENILIRGILLGMTRRDAQRLIEPIRDFTELAEKLDYPIRTYSTGMLLRLAFAISTAIRPDILVMDEMIGAGDASFVEKARARVGAMIDASSVLVLSSHNLAIVREFCTSAILLEDGRIAASGDVEHVIRSYEASL
jgi:ABC-2 type transport system ATP-binding protein/lipopolysaccharide transport system ATP-binding protein